MGRNGLATHFTGKTKLALKECQVMGRNLFATHFTDKTKLIIYLYSVRSMATSHS